MPNSEPYVGEAYSYSLFYTYYEDEPFSADLSANFGDPDGDPLTFSLSIAGGTPVPSWLHMSSGGTLYGSAPTSESYVQFEVTASDGLLSASATYLFQVNAVNDAPRVVHPVADQHLSEDSSFYFVLPDGTFFDEEGDEVYYGALCPTWITNDSSTFFGTPPLNANGNFDITISASDVYGAVTPYTIHFIIDPVNDRPTLSPNAPALSSVNQDAINDVGQRVADILQENVQDGDGTADGLAVSGNTQNAGTWQYSTDDGATWADFGSVSEAHALLLGSNDRVRFLPDGTGASQDQFTFYAWDMSSGVAGSYQVITDSADGAFSEFAYSASISVVLSNGVNDAPVLAPTNPELAPFSNGGNLVTKTVADLIGGSISDIDTGALTPGIAVNRVQGSGIWQFSHNGGTTWTTISGLSDANAVLLVATDLIRFTPGSSANGPASFGYYGWDQTVGTAGAHVNVSIRGGTTAYSLEHDFASISANDILTGTDGSDTLIGLSGSDTLSGLDANDLLYGGSGNDSLDGGLDSDQLLGGEGNDTLLGGDQNDVLSGGTGNNLLHGGSGDDVLSVSSNGMNTMTGDDGNDVVTGSAGNDGLDGGMGNDLLTGGVGDDTLTGGSGNDVLAGGDGNDVMSGGDQNDLLTGGAGNNILYGGVGDDTLTGGAADDLITGGGGLDVIDAGAGNNAVYGGQSAHTENGNDTIVGVTNVFAGDGNNAIYGGQTAHADSGDDTIVGVTYAFASDGDNIIGVSTNAYAGSGNDLIYDSGSGGTIDPGAGNDFVSVFLNASVPSTIDGGAGNDTLVAQHLSANFTTGFTGFETIIADTLTLADETGLAGSWLTVGGLNFQTASILGVAPHYLSYGDVELTHLDGSAELDAQLFVHGSADGSATLIGGQQSDELYGGNLANALDGQNGDDLLTSGSGNDTIVGGSGDDTMVGGDGNDLFLEGAGNDSIDGGLAVDTVVYGGNAADYSVVESAYLTLTVTGPDGVDTLRSVRTVQFADQSFTFIPVGILLIGGDDPDSLYGGVGPDQIDGAAGDDSLLGLSGNDMISGGVGNDLLNGGIGSDSIDGGAGNDSVSGGNGADFIETADGNDTVDAGAGNDLIVGGNGAGNDRYTGGTGVDTVRYSSAVTGITVDFATTTASGNEIGQDRLFGIENIIGGQSGDNLSGDAMANQFDGGTGSDTMAGRAGDDTYLVDRLSDSVSEVAGEGTDTVIATVTGVTLAANVENLVLAGTTEGGAGNALDNLLLGNAAGNLLDAGDGIDTLDGNGGTDTLRGGAGDDHYVTDGADVIVEVAAAGIDTVMSSVTLSLAANLENLTLTGVNPINGSGNGLDNVLVGNAAGNTLSGGAGADTLRGGTGDDVYVTNGGDTISEAVNVGIDLVRSSATLILATNLENLTLTGAAAIDGTGNGLANVVTGNGQSNTLDGGKGADTLAGGAGDDTYVTDGLDIITEAVKAGNDTVLSSASLTLADNLETLTLTGNTAINGTGNGLANHLNGNAANNLLDGGAGADTLAGGAGNDRYFVEGGDTIIEVANSGVDTVLSSVSQTLGSNLENLTLTSSAAINGTGNELANVLIGNAAANLLNGGTGADTLQGGLGDDIYVTDGEDTISEAGNSGVDLVRSSASLTLSANIENLILTGALAIDAKGNALKNDLFGNAAANVLNGGEGSDVLTGNGGADAFLFSTPLGPANIDTVADYQLTTDKVWLDHLTLYGLALGALDATAFAANLTGKATDALQRIIYNTDSGGLYFDADGKGGIGGVHFADIGIGLAMTSGEFFVM